jgi:hypothetical protein
MKEGGAMRIRNTFWILLMLAAPAVVLAQEPQQSPQKPPEQPATEAQSAEQKPARTLTTAEKLRAQFPPAPKLGHPLDPADVDVLTGKTKSSNPYGPYGYRFAVDPYSGQGYSLNGASYDESVLSSPTGLFSSPFTFGDTRGRRFSLRNTSRAGMPILFFNRGATRRFVFLGRGLSFF